MAEQNLQHVVRVYDVVNQSMETLSQQTLKQYARQLRCGYALVDDCVKWRGTVSQMFVAEQFRDDGHAAYLSYLNQISTQIEECLSKIYTRLQTLSHAESAVSTCELLGLEHNEQYQEPAPTTAPTTAQPSKSQALDIRRSQKRDVVIQRLVDAELERYRVMAERERNKIYVSLRSVTCHIRSLVTCCLKISQDIEVQTLESPPTHEQVLDRMLLSFPAYVVAELANMQKDRTTVLILRDTVQHFSRARQAWFDHELQISTSDKGPTPLNNPDYLQSFFVTCPLSEKQAEELVVSCKSIDFYINGIYAVMSRVFPNKKLHKPSDHSSLCAAYNNYLDTAQKIHEQPYAFVLCK